MFWLALVLSGLLLLVFNLLAWRSKRLLPSVILAGFMASMGLMLSIPLILHGLSLCLLAGILAPFSRPRVGLASCLTTVAVYVFISWPAIQDVQQGWRKVREEYPLESLSARLAYETLRGRKPSSLPDGMEPRNQKADARLAEIEEKVETYWSTRRTDSLELAHAGVVR